MIFQGFVKPSVIFIEHNSHSKSSWSAVTLYVFSLFPPLQRLLLLMAKLFGLNLRYLGQ